MLLVAIMGCYVAKAQEGDSKPLARVKANADMVKITPTNKKAPIIGLSSSYSDGTTKVGHDYYDAIIRAGGIPFLIPVDTTEAYLKQVVESIDGLLLIGGVDVDPSFYKEEAIEQMGEIEPMRDLNELKLIRLASNRNVPIFGICRGVQMINVAFGGTLYQDLPSQHGGDVTHSAIDGVRSKHMVTLDANSKVAQILGKTKLEVNSSHHQAVKDVAKGAKINGYSPDSVVEAIDFYPLHRIFGVQWHPEGFKGKSSDQNKLFSFFVGEAALYKKAKDFHSRNLSIDTHTDAPLRYVDGRGALSKRSGSRANLAKMQEGMLDAQFLAAWVPSDSGVVVAGTRKEIAKPLNDITFNNTWTRTLQLINTVHEQVEKNQELCGLAQTMDDVARLKAEGKKAIFIGVENGLGIGKDISRVKALKDLGVKYITLTHTYDNQICHTSSQSEDSSKGLTDFGKKVVKEMNKLGIMVDLSHCSEGTFWEVVKNSKKPIICSHSGARALCDHDRNLTDDQLKALAKNGGVVQTVIYGPFLRKEGRKATLMDVVTHIDYMVKVAGINHVGIGSDFDGGGGVPGCDGDNDLINITMCLMEMGYSEEDLAKIWGKNFFRVMREA